MKKILMTIGTGALFGFSLLAAETLVSIDGLKIMQESHEGKEVAAQIQGDIEKYQGDVRNAQRELSDMQDELNKKAKVLSQDAIQEKTEAINKKKKDMDRNLADKEEMLRMSLQRKQIALRDKQLKIANDVAQKENWGMVVDKNTPGVLFVSSAIDKTDLVLKAVNEKYVATSATKPAKNIQTAKNDTKKATKKTTTAA